MGFNRDTASKAGKKSKRGSNEELKEIREHFTSILTENKENVSEWLNEVALENPAKALELFIKLSSFILPKPRPMDVPELKEIVKPPEIRFFNPDTEPMDDFERR